MRIVTKNISGFIKLFKLFFYKTIQIISAVSETAENIKT